MEKPLYNVCFTHLHRNLSCTTVVVHNRDQAEIFQNTLIERTPKAAFRALDFISKTF